MMDEGGPFADSWTYDISPNDGGSRVVLTEVASFKNPLFRVMARVFGQTKYLDEHLEDLARKFGETASVGQRITVLGGVCTFVPQLSGRSESGRGTRKLRKINLDELRAIY